MLKPHKVIIVCLISYCFGSALVKGRLHDCNKFYSFYYATVEFLSDSLSVIDELVDSVVVFVVGVGVISIVVVDGVVDVVGGGVVGAVDVGSDIFVVGFVDLFGWVFTTVCNSVVAAA